MIPQNKVWYLSVTVWFNFITLILGTLELLQTIDLGIPPKYLLLGIGFGNLVLRLFFTKTNLETPAKVAEQEAGLK